MAWEKKQFLPAGIQSIDFVCPPPKYKSAPLPTGHWGEKGIRDLTLWLFSANIDRKIRLPGSVLKKVDFLGRMRRH